MYHISGHDEYGVNFSFITHEIVLLAIGSDLDITSFHLNFEYLGHYGLDQNHISLYKADRRIGIKTSTDLQCKPWFINKYKLMAVRQDKLFYANLS